MNKLQALKPIGLSMLVSLALGGCGEQSAALKECTAAITARAKDKAKIETTDSRFLSTSEMITRRDKYREDADQQEETRNSCRKRFSALELLAGADDCGIDTAWLTGMKALPFSDALELANSDADRYLFMLIRYQYIPFESEPNLSTTICTYDRSKETASEDTFGGGEDF